MKTKSNKRHVKRKTLINNHKNLRNSNRNYSPKIRNKSKKTKSIRKQSGGKWLLTSQQEVAKGAAKGVKAASRLTKAQREAANRS
jgi:hypothetical protein